MSIIGDIQELELDAIITMYEIDVSAIGGGSSPLRIYNGYNEKLEFLTWQGNEYTALPAESFGFSLSGQGQQSRPTLRVSNTNNIISSFKLGLQDLVGAIFTRKRTHLRYLDAVNFTSGNPEADPTAYYPDDVYVFEQKTNENIMTVEWSLSSYLDLQGTLLPLEMLSQDTCPYEYKDGTNCTWVPGIYYDVDDQATSSLSEDLCSHRLSGCLVRFTGSSSGNWKTSDINGIPFGAFPGLARVQ